MTIRSLFRLGLIALLLFAVGCAPPTTQVGTIGSTPLQDKYSTYFTIGAATTPSKLAAVQNIVDFHFDRLTCENDMKWGVIHPDAGTWNFTAADALADYARGRGITMTGHALIWHNQLPANNWMFTGLTPDTDGARSALKTIMQTHIDTLVERYYDVIDNWDVVNEAISDGGGYRTDSPWYEYFGSEEYIYWAFRYTKDALEAHAGGTGTSLGKLYYNDYSVVNSTKLNAIIDMVKWLRQDPSTPPLPAGQSPIAIDGVGLQAHWQMDWPNTTLIQNAINAIDGAGLKAKISELDISASYGSSGTINFTSELAQIQANRYAAIFSVFRSNNDKISSVTFWGVSDDQSWLNNFPVSGRDDYPLLFDRSHNAKPAYYAVIDFN
ncbi:MAG: endo-1,4-beta-xylanase [Spirochaetales bacterium]|nr:endo-1,4-beta-xylanase [Spirochaetales bacterium]